MSISNLFDLIIKHMGRLVKCVLRCAIIVISSIAIIITEKNLGVGVIVIQLYVARFLKMLLFDTWSNSLNSYRLSRS